MMLMLIFYVNMSWISKSRMLKTSNPSTTTCLDQATMASFGMISSLECAFIFSNSQCVMDSFYWLIKHSSWENNLSFLEMWFSTQQDDFCFMSHRHIGTSSFHFKGNCQFEAIRFNKCRMYPSWLKRKRGAADAIRHISIAFIWDCWFEFREP